MKFAHGLSSLFVATAIAFAHFQTCVAHPHEHDHMKRNVPSVPLTPPSSPLVWGDLNIIHTTDTHGWLAGHKHNDSTEQYYSADFGGFYDFVTHMKDIALEKDVDLLLVDSGDVHDGTGYSDGGPPGSIDAYASNQYIKRLPYDVLAIGNHELYIYNNTLNMFQDFAPFWQGKYLSSNVNITVPINGKNVSVPVGSRYRKFTTRKGRRVTSFGVLYDFDGNDEGTYVQYVANMVKEEWFLDAIKEKPDFFLLVGHMPVSKDNWPLVFNAIRAVHPTTPILIFGGHTHIRDCNQPDGRSMALESGRYMETVGWMSVKDLNTVGNLTFSRRYLDPNPVTYMHHTGRNLFNFNTFEGLEITAGLAQLAKIFGLSTLYGTAPETYSISQSPFNSSGSVLNLLSTKVMPYALSVNNTRSNISSLSCVNSGEMRFGIFEGTFDKNDALTALPFEDAFVYIPNITASILGQVQNTLNGDSYSKRDLLLEGRENELYKRGSVQKRYDEWLREMSKRHYAIEKRVAENLTEGYVTTDSCPGEGDDTKHLPLPYYYYPDYLCSNMPDVANDTSMDFVFINYIQEDALSALNKLQSEKKYTDVDVLSYTAITADKFFPIYAMEYWK